MAEISGPLKETLMARKYGQKDLKDMILIWNEIVEEGIGFPPMLILCVVPARRMNRKTTE